MAIIAFVLVAIPVAFAIRGLATACESLPANPMWAPRSCTLDTGRVLANIEMSLVVIGIASFGGGVGWFVAARQHRPRRWPAVATGVVIAMSAVYAVYIQLTLASLGKWSF